MRGRHCSRLIVSRLAKVCMVKGRGEGGYVSLIHFVLQFIGVPNGVGGAIWLNIAGIYKVLAMSFIC